ncbi:MAG: MBOAT family protein [Planctomycetes bacterium]|nr:MBOAT family protein [Planctomycetota bacterium]
MAFSSILFLFCFLPVFLVVYLASPNRWRNLLAVVSSLAFYAWGAPLFVYVLVIGAGLDYWVSCQISKSRSYGADQPAVRELCLRYLQLSLVVNVGLLLYFKYANFFVAQFDDLLALCGIESIAWTSVVLPIGISFFTFHKISYVVDVYWGRTAPARSFGDCLLYLLLFPQLIAGPIIRYHDVDSQIRSRRLSVAQFWSGVERFTLGLAKKVLIANAMAELCDPIYKTQAAFVPTCYAWLAAVAYYFQIYFDFSGYSDMAIGLGRMMGFEFRENFERPYIAQTFTEFWRRWHISLSNFMREYIYIPLGGNRCSPVRGYINLWIVFLLSGFWHGASWNFIVWGAFQGLFLTIDKLVWSKLSQRVPKLLLRLSMVLLVMISWVIFRSDTMTQAKDLLLRMFFGGGPQWYEYWHTTNSRLDGQAIAMLAAAVVVSFAPWSAAYCAFEGWFLAWRKTSLGSFVMMIVVFLLLVVASIRVVNSSYNPFIYFRF